MWNMFKVNKATERLNNVVRVSLLLTLNKFNNFFSSILITGFEQVIIWLDYHLL